MHVFLHKTIAEKVYCEYERESESNAILRITFISVKEVYHS